MESYQDSIPPETCSAASDLSPAACNSVAPTANEIAQWKDESDRFLDDVERRLNEILVEFNQFQPATEPLALPRETRDSPEVSCDDDHTASPDADDGDRISALKAQLAQKLHNFEENNDYAADNDSGPEVRT